MVERYRVQPRGLANAGRVLAAVLVLGLVPACTTDRTRERFDPRPLSPAAGASDRTNRTDAGATGPLMPQPELAAEACGSAPVLSGEFSRERLRSAASGCAQWHYCQFESVAGALRAALERDAAQPSEQTAADARAAWVQAMLVWSRVELFQFGPLSSSATTEGKDSYQGRGLRDRVYAWPGVSACRVEDQLLSRAYESDMKAVFPSARGLFALEYLLFAPATDSACPAGSANAQMWAALSEIERAERKRAYAVALASDVEATVRSLRALWSPSGENFEQLFVSASGYPDEQEAMNVLAWALIYVERELKDWKLGIPAGQTMTTRVTVPETPYAAIGTEAMLANLLGFRSLLQGCGPAGEGLGFDDWLVAASHAELASDLDSAWQAASGALQALGPLHGAQPAALESAHGVTRELTNLLKGDLFGAGSPLNLKTPASVEGDTD